MRFDLAWVLVSAGSGVTGTLASTEATDTSAFTGNWDNSGVLSVTEVIDTASFAGNFTDQGILNTTETVDISAFSGNFIISGTLSTVETVDIASFAGPLQGSLSTIEAPDIASFIEQLLTGGGYSGKSIWQKGMETFKPPKPFKQQSNDIQKAAAHMSSLGGHARAASLSAPQRIKIATKAANTRWG